MNAAERLAHELERCTIIRERYRALDGMPGVNVAPVISMLTDALHQGKRAAGSNDAVAVVHAIKALETFTE